MAAAAATLLGSTLAPGASAAAPPASLAGRVTDAAGLPLAGARVELVVNTTTPNGRHAPFAITQTDQQGRYALPLRASTSLLQSAARNGGHLVVDVFVLKDLGAGGVFLAHDVADSAVLNNALSSVPGVDLTAHFDAGLSSTHQAVSGAATAALQGRARSYPPNDGGDGRHTYPTNPCPDYLASQAYAATYKTADYQAPVTLGELHVPAYSSAQFIYTSSGSTSFHAALRYNAGGWTMGGSYSRSHVGVKANSTSAGAHVYRLVKGQFYWHDTRTYVCRAEGGREVVASYNDTVYVDKWTGELHVDSADRSYLDSASAYSEAVKANRAVRFIGTQGPSYGDTSGYTYGAETAAFGVTVGSQTQWSRSSSLGYTMVIPAGKAVSLFSRTGKPLMGPTTYAYDA